MRNAKIIVKVNTKPQQKVSPFSEFFSQQKRIYNQVKHLCRNIFAKIVNG